MIDQILMETLEDLKDTNIDKNRLEERENQIKEKVFPIIEVAEKKIELENYCNEMKKKMYEDPDLLKYLSNYDRRAMDEDIGECLEWLADNPNVTSAEIDNERINLKEKLEKTVDKVKSHADLENYINKLKESLKDEEISSKLSDDERKIIEDEIEKTSQWLNENPNAKKEEYDSKKQELKSVVEPIFKKFAKRNEVENYFNDLKNELANDYGLLNKLSDYDRKIIEQELENGIDLLGDNLSDFDLNLLKNKVAEIIDPILQKSNDLKELEERCYDIELKLDDPDFVANLTTSEKNKLDEVAKILNAIKDKKN
jgi:hypothetical protein